MNSNKNRLTWYHPLSMKRRNQYHHQHRLFHGLITVLRRLRIQIRCLNISSYTRNQRRRLVVGVVSALSCEDCYSVSGGNIFLYYLLLVYSLCGRSSFPVLSSVIFIMPFFFIVLGYKSHRYHHHQIHLPCFRVRDLRTCSLLFFFSLLLLS